MNTFTNSQFNKVHVLISKDTKLSQLSFTNFSFWFIKENFISYISLLIHFSVYFLNSPRMLRLLQKDRLSGLNQNKCYDQFSRAQFKVLCCDVCMQINCDVLKVWSVFVSFVHFVR